MKHVDEAPCIRDLRQLRPGHRVDARFELVSLVAEGGQGHLWRARDRSLDLDVALKFLPAHDPWRAPDATEQEVRALREARAMARLMHPSIARVHQVLRHGPFPVIVTAWYNGADLATWMRQREAPWEVVFQWLMALLVALDHAHGRGVLHCDIKPENIIIRDHLPPEQALVVVDFGLARGPRLQHRSHTQRAGTRRYLPPEAGAATPCPLTDQYAVGVLAQELWRWADARPAHQQHLTAAFARAAAPHRSDRFPSVRALADALVVVPEPSSSEPTADHVGLEPARRWALAAEAMLYEPAWLKSVFPSAGSSHVGEDTPAQTHHPSPGEALQALEALGPQERLALHARIAGALELGVERCPWRRAEAARHWLACGRPEEAARHLARLAVEERDIERRIELKRAVVDLSFHPQKRLSACLDWGREASRLGWRRDAERALAQGLEAAVQCTSGGSGAVWHLRAYVRTLRGSQGEAEAAWRRALAEGTSDAMGCVARVGLSRTLSLLGRFDEAVEQASVAANWAPEHQISALIAQGIAEEGAGRSQSLQTLRRAAWLSVERAEPLAVVDATLALSEALRRRQRRAELKLYLRDVEEQLAHLPLVSNHGSYQLLLARAAAGEGLWMRAHTFAWTSMASFERLRLWVRARSACQLALHAATEAREAELTRAALERLHRLASLVRPDRVRARR